jgi:hypothetical protein
MRDWGLIRVLRPLDVTIIILFGFLLLSLRRFGSAQPQEIENHDVYISHCYGGRVIGG